MGTISEDILSELYDRSRMAMMSDHQHAITNSPLTFLFPYWYLASRINHRLKLLERRLRCEL
jgi:predicted component of type VI protein secretion system